MLEPKRDEDEADEQSNEQSCRAGYGLRIAAQQRDEEDGDQAGESTKCRRHAEPESDTACVFGACHCRTSALCLEPRPVAGQAILHDGVELWKIGLRRDCEEPARRTRRHAIGREQTGEPVLLYVGRPAVQNDSPPSSLVWAAQLAIELRKRSAMHERR